MKNTLHRIIAYAIISFIVISVGFAEKERVYISPNNDGIQDELIIPIKITEKRYIKEWSFVIEDEKSSTVRKIGNKETRPEKLTFITFWKQLFTPKKGVDVPNTVMWNGILDSGELAEDGLYYYYLTAEDDNGNISKTNSLEVFVDNTAPDINLTQPKESAKIFGAGNKPSISIEQSGSVEDLWTATITDVSGNIIKSWTWKNSAPQNVIWDGKDNSGNASSEGVYSYSITATDKAGNSSEAVSVDNIIYDAIPRSVNLMIEGSPFSPLSGTDQQNLNIIPTMTSSTGLMDWSISINNSSEKEVMKWSGEKESPGPINFDGLGIDSKVLEDGEYKITFFSSFNNGQSAEISRKFTVDTTKPRASVHIGNEIFSPDGDGNKDSLTIFQEGSKEKSWVGTIYTEEGKAVRTYNYGSLPDEHIIWDGTTEEGDIVDGFYTYELTATDLAGNIGSAKTQMFELNTGTTEVILSVSPDAFSPNADKVQDTVVFTPIIKTDTGISEYKLSILDATGKLVRIITAKRSLPDSISWNGIADDGTRCADGMYSASLYTLSKNGSEATINTRAFELDSTLPEVKVSTEYTVFSPNSDGNKDTIPFNIASSSENRWVASISELTTGATIRDFTWSEKAESFDWDGTDESGNIVLDGTYVFTVSATDNAGNTATARLDEIKVDNRPVKVYLTAENDAISSNGDGNADVQDFSILTSLNEGISTWSFVIKNAETNKNIRTWNQTDSESVPASIKWDGRDENGTVVEGSFIGALQISYVKGDLVNVETSSFINWITPPQLLVKTTPEYFSPDNDGVDDELYIALSAKSDVPFTSWSFIIKDPNNGNIFWSTEGNSTIKERMIWDGRGDNGELVQSAMNYPFEFKVTDSLGMVSTAQGEIKVDVLVIRIGDVLKIQVPSIIFRADNADFKNKSEVANGLDSSVIENNERVLKRISEILDKFKNYDVTIEGHANNISGTEIEETQDTAMYGKALVPLSELRAEFVKDKLVSYGINKMRLSTKGMGGRSPVVARTDKDNWWKNRRVEFILNK